MIRKEQYRDMEKYKKTKRQQKRRYYKKTQIYAANRWTDMADELILKHEKTDTELSKIIGHSVNAIQIRRSHLKKQNDGLSVKE